MNKFTLEADLSLRGTMYHQPAYNELQTTILV